jgi:hypothetical protein
LSEALIQMEAVVERGDDTNEIRIDVALDLDQVIDDFQDDLDDDDGVDADKRLGEIRTKISLRVREGGLTQGRADKLNAIMARIKL